MAKPFFNKPKKSGAQEIADNAFAHMKHIDTVYVDEKTGKYYLKDMGALKNDAKVEGLIKVERKAEVETEEQTEVETKD